MEHAELIFDGLEQATPARRPFFAYLARLGPGSRETMAGCLATICRGDPSAFAWELLRREHTLVIRGWLVERYASDGGEAPRGAARDSARGVALGPDGRRRLRAGGRSAGGARR